MIVDIHYHLFAGEETVGDELASAQRHCCFRHGCGVVEMWLTAAMRLGSRLVVGR